MIQLLCQSRQAGAPAPARQPRQVLVVGWVICGVQPVSVGIRVAGPLYPSRGPPATGPHIAGPSSQGRLVVAVAHTAGGATAHTAGSLMICGVKVGLT